VVTSIFQLDYSHIDIYHFLLSRRAHFLEMAEIFGAVASGAGLVSLSMQLLESAVDKVDRPVHKARFAGRVYMGFKEPEVKRLLVEMEHAKSSMSLAYMSYCQYATVCTPTEPLKAD
jgi:hypothetical protein